ncbi:response regulator transcription factor [Pontiella agarivorans]|uniref:Response regulator transcription factor n=1 Tax=Pontiella agarivorans TaxID=3038953 RepID=A0ABU5MUD5_9BACT|nr:response regulator transcription factor [Pontiella agarivorans]MDZ8117798.1 response regulator transcription factor [Pontiella agarivorans]
MSDKISVMIVDDNGLLRVGLKDIISDEGDMTTVAEAATGEEAVGLYSECHPDVVTMDYRMPDLDGLEASKRILSQFPDAKILFLSTYEGEEDIWNAWQTGVAGYLSKADAYEHIIEAIREAAEGRSYFPAAIARKLEARKGQASLTPRELEVLKLIVAGNSNKEIMGELDLSASTVRVHVSNVLEKLGVLDRTQAAIAAVKRGIVHL